jgi:FkbM family methyltransferase
LVSKFKIIFKLIKTVKNWYLYPLVYFKLVKRSHIIFETKSGIKIKIRVKSSDLMAFTHVWLIEEYSGKNFSFNNSDTIIDVGSHIGLFALFASQFCKQGKIICYEPIKENYQMLLSNLELNHLSNVVCYNKAVSKSNSKIRIYLNSDESGHSMFEPQENFVDIDSISLQQIMDDHNLDSIDFLKLDCEGAEYEIIENFPKSRFPQIKKMIIEYHLADKKPQLLKNLLNILKSNSFEVSKKSLFSDIGFLYVEKK